MKKQLLCSLLVAVMCLGSAFSLCAETVSVDEAFAFLEEAEEEAQEIAAEGAAPFIQGVSGKIEICEMKEYVLAFLGTENAKMTAAIYKADYKEGDDPLVVTPASFDADGKASVRLDLSQCAAGDYTIVYYYTDAKADAQSISLFIRKSIDSQQNARITKTAVEDVVYTGKEAEPNIILEETVDGKVYALVKGTDFEAKLSSDNKSKYGKATVEIKGIGNYTGTISRDFYILPAAPAITSAECIGYKSAKVSWTKVAGVEGYELERKTGSGSFEKIASVKGEGTLTYTDDANTLKTGESYYYRVKAVRASEVDVSETIASRPSSEDGVMVKLLPQIPKLKSLDSASGSKLKLVWEPVDGASGYTIYQILDDGTLKSVKTLKAVSYSITKDKATGKKLVCGNTYRYTVKAYTEDAVTGNKIYGGADQSGIKAKVKPAAPKLVSAKATSYNRVKIKWKEVSGAYGYYVYRKEANNENSKWKKIKTVKYGDTTSAIDKKATPGTTYVYSVKSYTKVNGKKIASDMNQTGKKATPLPGKPAVKLAQVDKTVEIKISNASGADGFYIYRKVNGGNYINYKRIEAKSGDTTVYKDTAVEAAATYEYYVIPYVEGESKRLKGEKSSEVKIIVS